jgi:ppGpp synthetase/RelA/SpoT-type nucleotidyltranferase
MSYSKNKIKNSGKKLIDNINDEESLEVLSYWRTCHASSLEEGYQILRDNAQSVDKSLLLAKRLKRTESIVNKLKRLKGKVQLTTMNDIAGCRAIVSNEKKVYQLVNKLIKTSDYEVFRDYILKPRDSGYKSVHLIGKFLNENNIARPVELQIRTKVQHSWATAVEIVDLFTKDSIKTNEGTKEWSSLFRYASKVLSLFDKNPFINVLKNEKNTEETIKKNQAQIYAFFKKQCHNKKSIEKDISEVYKLCKKLGLREKFDAFSLSLKSTNEHIEQSPLNGYVLIIIDKIDKNSFGVSSEIFPIDRFEEATAKYLEAEKNVLINKHFVTALVSTNAVGGIKKAYPNYFADATKFLEYITMINMIQEEKTSLFDKILNYFK